MECGPALVPGDGDAWDRLGRLRQWDFVNPDLPGAIVNYEEATRVNPRSAYFWMDLAGGYDAAGDAARAQDAYAHAEIVYRLRRRWHFTTAIFFCARRNILKRTRNSSELFAAIRSFCLW